MKYKVGDYYVWKYLWVEILLRVKVVSKKTIRYTVIQSNWYGRVVGEMVSYNIDEECIYPYTFDVGI